MSEIIAAIISSILSVWLYRKGLVYKAEMEYSEKLSDGKLYYIVPKERYLEMESARFKQGLFSMTRERP